ncbi:hypothetical protein GCM10028805_54480 [Spirosoma harenae]
MDSFLQALAELPALLIRLSVQLEANSKALQAANELLDNQRYDEAQAAKFLGVKPKTMYHYRQGGWISYEKVGRRVTYLLKDLNDFKAKGRIERRNN